MEVQIAVAKIKKYATSSSGDTVEVVERPHGGLSVVMADGQSSGHGAKKISTLVVRKVISLLAEGVRDGAAARAASDYLFAERNGKVSATLNILSVDLHSRSLVLTRNNPAPALVVTAGAIITLDEPCKPIGLYRDTRPVISQFNLDAGLTAVIFTDGLIFAGERYGRPMEIRNSLQYLLDQNITQPESLADELLAIAMTLDQNRPSDDISVVVLGVSSFSGDEVRRMTVRLPLIP